MADVGQAWVCFFCEGSVLVEEIDDVCEQLLPWVGTCEDGCCWLVLEGFCEAGDGCDKGALAFGADEKRD